MTDRAIRILYPETTTIINNKAFDNNGVKIVVDKIKVDAKVVELENKAQIKTKISELQTAYNSANETDIVYMSTPFQADKASQDLITGILAGGAVPSGFIWRDNTKPTNVGVPMTFTEFQGLSQAIVARGQGNWIRYQDLKSQVDLAKTQADLDLIVW